MRLGHLRLELQSPAEVVHRLVELLLLVTSASQVAVRLGKTGSYFNGAAKTVGRFGKLWWLGPCTAHLIPRQGVIGLKIQGPGKVTAGLLGFAQCPIGPPQVAVRDRHVRIEVRRANN